MASIIKIKRSGTVGNPSILGSGEMAYTYLTDNGINGGDRLYIGTGSENMSGNAAVHEIIGGKYYTRLIDAQASDGKNPGQLTTAAKSVPVLSATGTIDKWYVGNVYTHDNTITTTDTDGNLILNPNGAGKVSIANAWTLPRSTGSNKYILQTNGTDASSWAEAKMYIGTTAVNLFNTSGTVTSLAVDISGKATTAGTADQVAHALTKGTDISYDVGSTFDGSTSVTISVSSTLDSVTGRGSSTTHAITTGGLTINSGVHPYTLPSQDGTANYYLQTDGSGNLSWAEAAATFNIAGTTGSHTLDLANDTFNIVGGSSPITVAVSSNSGAKTTTATISVSDASTSAKGLASFSPDTFSASSGSINVKSGGISNAQLAYSSFYIGTTNISLGDVSGHTTSLAVDISGKATTAGSADNVGHTLSAGTDIDFDSGLTYDGSTNKTLNVTSTFDSVVGRGSTTTSSITVGGLTINSGSHSYSLPAQDGTANYYLKTDGSGTLSWAALNQTFYLGSTQIGTTSGSTTSVSGFTSLTGGNFERNYVKVGDNGFGPALGTTNSDSDVRIETGAGGSVTHTWLFKKDGKTTFNNAYTFPASDASGAGYILSSDGMGNVSWVSPTAGQEQANWTETDNTKPSYIKNKPTLATVATSGSYNDLSNTPMLATVATSGSYNDLSNTPMLATVATSGNYSDLNGYPTSITSFGITDGYPGTVLVTDGAGNFSFSSTISGLTSVNIGDLTIHNDNTIEFTGVATDGDITLKPKGAGHISASNAYIRDVKDPQADQDAATKKYVDGIAQGIHTHDSVKAATGATLASISGGTVAYDNGTAGVGAFITLSTPITMLDSYSLANGNRILVKNEGDVGGLGLYANGVYTWATGGNILTRATDFDQTTEVAGGDFVFVTSGTQYGKTGWVQVDKTTAIGSGHDIEFRQFSGAGTYLAGDGLTITGNTFSVNVAASGGLEIVNDDLQLKSTVAGAGLSYNNGVIDVVGTSGKIAIVDDKVTIDSTYEGQGSIITVSSTTGITTGVWKATAIGSGYGGTGFTTYAKGDLLYASDTNTLSKLTAGSEGQVLEIVNGVPQWITLDGGEYV